jgi:acyl carrier protein
MGLDLVELVMEVEERYAISIDDRDAEKIQTVGQLYEYVLAKQAQAQKSAPVAAAPQRACASAVTFYKVRRELVEFLDVPRESIRPSTSLALLLPDPGPRRRAWLHLQQTVGRGGLPGLRRPLWTHFLCAAIGLVFIAQGTIPFVLFGIVAWITAVVATSPLATGLSPACSTVGQLVNAALRKYLDDFKKPLDQLTPTELWHDLCALIGEQLGVDPNELKRETSFVNDLGAD